MMEDEIVADAGDGAAGGDIEAAPPLQAAGIGLAALRLGVGARRPVRRCRPVLDGDPVALNSGTAMAPRRLPIR